MVKVKDVLWHVAGTEESHTCKKCGKTFVVAQSNLDDDEPFEIIISPCECYECKE